MSVIDVWSQIQTERMAKEPWLETLLKWTKQTDSLVVPTVRSTLQAMNEAGVNISILSAWHGPHGSLISNQEVSDQIDQAPDRFRGLVSVDLNKPMEAVREIRKWVDKDRFVGVRVVPWLWDLPPNNRKYYLVYTACVDLGVPFCT